MTPVPISCFSEKDQLMYEGNKAIFVQKCLRDNVFLINSREQNIDTFIVDKGWLLPQNNLGKRGKWGDIIDWYVQLVKSQGHRCSCRTPWL